MSFGLLISTWASMIFFSGISLLRKQVSPCLPRGSIYVKSVRGKTKCLRAEVLLCIVYFVFITFFAFSNDNIPAIFSKSAPGLEPKLASAYYVFML